MIICAILPWTGNMAATRDTFESNIDLYNKFLFHICSSSDKLVFHWHRGFTNKHLSVGGKKMAVRRSVSDWSDDGTHPNASNMPKYIQRVRQAILQQVNSRPNHAEQ